MEVRPRRPRVRDARVADDGTIYAASDAKKLVALSPEGKTRWTLDTDDEADTGIALAPDGTVVLAAGRRVYGVSPQGFVKWRFAAKRKVFTAPAIAAGGRRRLRLAGPPRRTR